MASQQEESGFACCGVGILLSIPNIKMTRKNIINIIYYCFSSLSIVLSIPNIKMKRRNKEYGHEMRVTLILVVMMSKSGSTADDCDNLRWKIGR